MTAGYLPITRMLREWTEGNGRVLSPGIEAVYQRLCGIAARQMSRERSGHTLQAGDLAHETWLHLAKQTRVEWQNRGHFFAVATQLMRRVLLKYGARRRALKRGGYAARTSLQELAAEDWSANPSSTENLALRHALDRLQAWDPRQATIVEMHFFKGMNIPDVAAALGISTSTVKREWRMARAWLCHVLTGKGAESQRDACH
jgi:RNA polymerase sigma factor (TIGR02999 family)